MMNASHQIFLQALWNRKQVFSNEELEAFLTHMKESKPDLVPQEASLREYIRIINQHLESLHFQVRKIKRNEDQKVFWGVVNTNQDTIIKEQSLWPLHTLEVFNVILRNLIDQQQEASSISDVTAAVRLKFKTIKPSTVNESVKQLINEGWLIENEDGKIIMAPKAHLEMKSYFVDLDNTGYTY